MKLHDDNRAAGVVDEFIVSGSWLMPESYFDAIVTIEAVTRHVLHRN